MKGLPSAAAVACAMIVVCASHQPEEEADARDSCDSSNVQAKTTISILSEADHTQALAKWRSRWSEGNIGFHLDNVHPLLLRFADDLLGSPISARQGQSVLMPLCGKSKDMTWLAVSGHRVFGVEISSLACDQFFQEAFLPRTSWTPQQSQGIRRAHASGNIGILEGDLFALGAQTTKKGDVAPRNSSSAGTTRDDLEALIEGRAQVDAIWDRGSMVAIEPGLRNQYASLMAGLLKPGGRILLVSVHYDESLVQGPPHSLRYNELHELYGAHGFSIKLLNAQDVINTAPPRMTAAGLKSMTEAVYLLTKNI